MESPPVPTSPAQGDPLLALSLLRDFFQARSNAGQTRIALAPASLQALRQIVTSKVGGVAAAPEPIADPKPALSKPAQQNAQPPLQRPPEPSQETAAAAPISLPAPAAPIPAPKVRAPKLPLEERQLRLAELRAAAANHEPARALGTLREIMVFAVGNPEAKLMFVGEAPGAEEEEKQEPFVGPAGLTLNKMLKAMGLERSDVYISNICKFRPSIPNQGSSNRKPDPNEMAACIGFVQQEIEIIQPEVIIALGATAAEGLLGMSGVAVGRVRAKFHDYNGTPVMVTYHPSYLLHNNAMSERRKVWEDLLKVMEKTELPISEKQRAFFLPKAATASQAGG